MNYQKSTQGEETTASAIALEILSSDINIPPMPAAGSKIMDMAQKPLHEIDIPEFCKIIEPDPGLHSKILQLANSPYYKGIEDVIGLKMAITRIGLQEAVNSANLYFLQKFLPNLGDLKGLSAKQYWAFSWACATAGRRLGHPNISMRAQPGELYVSGLLQGIGKIILAVYYSDQFAFCVERSQKLKASLQQAFLDEFGTTDNILASKLMSTWNLPTGICAAVEFCHNPWAAPEEYRELAALTHFSYCIASFSKIGTTGDGVILDPDSAWLVDWAQSPLSKKGLRDKVVNEIIDNLNEKSESITGVPPVEKTSQTDSPKNSFKKKNRNSTKRKPLPPERKGLWDWIKSIFSS